MSKQSSVHLEINGRLFRVNRLPGDPETGTAVGFALTSKSGSTEVVAFDHNGNATCGCYKRLFGECIHVRAIRAASKQLGGLPLRPQFQFFTRNLTLNDYAEAIAQEEGELNTVEAA